MRILHTSDWHLGRTLHGVDLHEHQEAFLDHLVELVQTRDIDAVLVSGDVYDRAFPAVDTVNLLSRTLTRLSRHTTVIVTPGNHDSAARLGFGSELMRDSVRILADVGDVDTPVVLAGEGFDVAVYGLPYLDPDLARVSFATSEGDLPPRSHEGVLTAAMQRIRADLASRSATERPVRSIVMAHAFIVGGLPSDSERDITIGGVDSAPSAVFESVDYVALGHLHGPQKITVPHSMTVARYSGSPLAYSFSERDHNKSTVLLEFGPDGPPRVELIPAPVPRRLKHLEGTMDALLGSDNAEWAEAWVRIFVTDSLYPTDMQARLRAQFPYALAIAHVPEASSATAAAPVVTEAMNPLEVTGQFVEYVTTTAPTDEESALLQMAYEAVNARKRSG
ncbi:MAG: exonuclease SbcCD subunit D [Kineosporiaceae bacterium]|nr:exonuclease SbcCD subunit D [Aeromicrobium sp.]